MNHCFADITLRDFSIAGAVSRVRCGGKETLLAWRETVPGQWQCVNELGTWNLAVEQQKSRFILRSSADLVKTLPKFDFDLFTLPAMELDHVYAFGVKMGRCRSFELPATEEAAFESYYTTCLTKNGVTLLISQPLVQPQYVVVTGKIQGKFVRDLAVTHQLRHYAPLHVEFAPVTLEAGDGLELLETYGKNAVEVPRSFPEKPECGWNSWDYYRWTVTEKEVLKNAEFIARDPVLRQHVKRIIVDDGWQYCYGEWEANSLFPSGMKFLASEVQKMGFTPGLWLAPSIVEPHARIAQLEYDMLGCSEGGQPCLCFDCMRRKGFVLDPTVEKSRKFLRDLFDRYSSMGFRYFKLDFLERTMDAARFADENVPRSEIIRKLMEPICEGVADRAEIMGCNYPFMAGNRYVSYSRVGGDIHAVWDSIVNNTPSVAGRFWMNKKLWINDPDFALCRGKDTGGSGEKLAPSFVFCTPESEYELRYSKTLASATYEELKVLLSVALMAGGAINLSDDMTLLNEAGLDLARKVVSAQGGEAAHPLDLFEHALPQRWLQKLSRGGRLLLVNWGETNAVYKLQVPEMPSRVRDFWQGREIAAPQETELAPHSCLLLEWQA